MSQWKKIYQDKVFSISTDNPSVIVQNVYQKFPNNSRVLDLGCGQGRNAVFLAEQGHNVDAVDIADLHFLDAIYSPIKEKINFSQSLVEDFEFIPDEYHVIILARLIQYLGLDVVNQLFKNSYSSLKKDGHLLVSYVMEGGMFNRNEKEYQAIQKFSHPVDLIVKSLNDLGFSVSVSSGAQSTKYVPFEEPIQSFDIIAIK
mgnify:FL=1